jgi:hypothetical protein
MAGRRARGYHGDIKTSDNPASDRAMTPRGAIAFGALFALVGAAIVAASLWAPDEKFHAPRWVVGAAGGSFLFFGSWIAVVYATGYDPGRGDETLPPPLVQLAFFLPGLTLFALPFHWIAFGPGERSFSGSLSLPFVAISHRSGETSGRAMFAIGAVLIDLIIVATCVKLIRRAARE